MGTEQQHINHITIDSRPSFSLHCYRRVVYYVDAPLFASICSIFTMSGLLSTFAN